MLKYENVVINYFGFYFNVKSPDCIIILAKHMPGIFLQPR